MSDQKEMFRARPILYRRHCGVLCDCDHLHVRLREIVIMETYVVGSICILLLIYLFFSLIRPEKF